ncbi:protein-tyrosine phosphatase family protein [Kocuria marina]|uniref:protein-tyrosine phosphatase family protein n=1 Tax=Kocuria marina TaxID=223184 RepID=UPI003F22E9A3
MKTTWSSGRGVVELPSGRVVRGRSLRYIARGESPEFGLYLGARSQAVEWEHLCLSWPDFGLPCDRAAFTAAVMVAWERAADERVEVACAGGRGRTGTTLACMAIVDGMDPDDAVRFVRARYDRRAVETPWQKRYVRSFGVLQ